MENNMVLCKSMPLLALPASKTTHCHSYQRHSKPRTISLTKTGSSSSSDARLDYLGRNGSLREAIEVLDSMAQRGARVEPGTYTNLLQSCIDRNCVHLGRELHARMHVVKEPDLFVETKLVSMYALCGCLKEAKKVFDRMRERNLFTWSAMIGACCRERKWREIVQLFYKMMVDGILPDDFLFTKILDACANCRDFVTGESIHSLVVRCGMSHRSMHITNTILTMYVKCGKVNVAKKFFYTMDERDEVAWNTLITGYCEKGEIEQAHKLFDEMSGDGIDPGLVTWNILIAAYSKLGHCDVGNNLMKKMASRGIAPDVYSWTSMISGAAKNNQTFLAIDLFEKMLLAEIEPTSVTISSVLSACVFLKSLVTGLQFHSIAVKMGFIDNLLVENSLIDMYSKCGELEAAQRVFNKMLVRDAYTWNSMIGGYFQAGYCSKAHELFMKMQDLDEPPNIVTWNVMISGHLQNGNEDQAMDFFQRIEKDGKLKRNTASWNSLISGYAQIGQKDKALGMFRKMQSFHFMPNVVTLISLLPICANLIAWKKVKEIHGHALRRYLACERSVENSLIDTYAKSGNIEYSRAIFDRMSSRDIISWNAIIGANVLHGHAGAAIYLFEQLKKMKFEPNRGTFASIIPAYSIAGMVDEGKQAFSSITEEFQIVPGLEHYTAMVELFGRSGRIREAMRFVDNLPIEPHSSIWSALLTACRIHGNIELALYAGERLFELEPFNFPIHSLISKAYASVRNFNDASHVIRLEKEKAATEPFGHCLMESKNIVHTFVTGDLSGPHSDRLYYWLQRVTSNLEVTSSSMGVALEDEDTEDISGVHSEKFALAFSLVDSCHDHKSIRIVKSLRMCSDCHRTAKYISMTHRCDIYISDANSFHHFKKGHCSCKDYW